MKKLFAIVLSLALLMGMCTTYAVAQGEAALTVSDYRNMRAATDFVCNMYWREVSSSFVCEVYYLCEDYCPEHISEDVCRISTDDLLAVARRVWPFMSENDLQTLFLDKAAAEFETGERGGKITQDGLFEVQFPGGWGVGYIIESDSGVFNGFVAEPDGTYSFYHTITPTVSVYDVFSEEEVQEIKALIQQGDGWQAEYKGKWCHEGMDGLMTSGDPVSRVFRYQLTDDGKVDYLSDEFGVAMPDDFDDEPVPSLKADEFQTLKAAADFVGNFRHKSQWDWQIDLLSYMDANAPQYVTDRYDDGDARAAEVPADVMEDLFYEAFVYANAGLFYQPCVATKGFFESDVEPFLNNGLYDEQKNTFTVYDPAMGGGTGYLYVGYMENDDGTYSFYYDQIDYEAYIDDYDYYHDQGIVPTMGSGYVITVRPESDGIALVSDLDADPLPALFDAEPAAPGDVDGKDGVSASDALMALQAATGKIDLTNAQIVAADVDGSGAVDATDALRILQFATGKISSL